MEDIKYVKKKDTGEVFIATPHLINGVQRGDFEAYYGALPWEQKEAEAEARDMAALLSEPEGEVVIPPDFEEPVETAIPQPKKAVRRR